MLIDLVVRSTFRIRKDFYAVNREAVRAPLHVILSAVPTGRIAVFLKFCRCAIHTSGLIGRKKRTDAEKKTVEAYKFANFKFIFL
jgi:hypothetical protein